LAFCRTTGREATRSGPKNLEERTERIHVRANASHHAVLKLVTEKKDDDSRLCYDRLGAAISKHTIPRLGGSPPIWGGLARSRRTSHFLSNEMGRAELYREHAEECLAFAKSIADPMWRAQCLAMAAQWREFAERESELTVGNNSRRRNIGVLKRMKSRAATQAKSA
jgi:hypothetical protein